MREISIIVDIVRPAAETGSRMQLASNGLGDSCAVHDVAHHMPIVRQRRTGEHRVSLESAVEVLDRLALASLRVVEVTLLDIQQVRVVQLRQLVHYVTRSLIAHKL